MTLIFDLLTAKQVTRVIGFHPVNFGLPGPYCSRGTRQTDGRTDRHYASSGSRGIKKYMLTTHEQEILSCYGKLGL